MAGQFWEPLRLVILHKRAHDLRMAFIVNSSPGAGLRFEPSETLPDEKAALAWAAGLAQRGMRLIKIRDTVTGQIFDERGLRDHILKAKQAEQESAALSREASN